MRPALLLLALVTALTAQQVKLPPFTKQKLSNGATLILIPRTDLPLLTLSVIARGGGEADPPDKAGLAWLTADLMQRGTPTLTADQIALKLDALGATINSGASEQAISLRSEFLSRDVDQVLPILSQIVREPSFPEIEVKQLLGRAADQVKSSKDNPNQSIGNYFRTFYYGPKHPYGHAMRGDELSIANMNRQAFVDFHKRMFAGRNLLVIAAGSFDAASLPGKLEQAFGAIPAGEAYTWAAEPSVARGAQPRLLLVDKPGATQTYFYIGQPGLRRGSPDEAGVNLVNTLFGGRFTSMLNDELRVNTGLTYGANSRVDRNRLTGPITITSFTKTETTERTIDLALQLLKKLGEQGLTDAQVKSAKAYVKGSYPTQYLETADQLSQILAEIDLFGLNRGEVDDLFSRIDAVNAERANALAKQYYRSDGLVFVLVGDASKIRQTVKKYSPNPIEIPVTKPGFGQ
jgi:zinc protease